MRELVVEAKTENLDQVLEFVAEDTEDLSMKVQTQLAITVEEIFVNIAHYAYQTGNGTAQIRVHCDETAVSLEFEDSGIAYNPLENETPDITLSAEEREIGGLGIFMVKEMMDQVSYRREGDRNILAVQKRI
jgi:anti-sigma regulatory factor (Ser/Thr protein kinase)